MITAAEAKTKRRRDAWLPTASLVDGAVTPIPEVNVFDRRFGVSLGT